MTDTRLLSRSQPPRRYAGIERVQFPGNPGATTALSQIDETLRRFFGNRGPFLERAVTWGDLVGSGVVRVSIPATGGSVPGDPIVTPGTGEEQDSRVPPAPTGLTATAAFVTIILEWNAPGFSYYGHAEVWRSSTDNLAEAVYIGETQATLYADAVGASGITYYYWVRFVSKAGKPGAFNAVAGTSATTAPNIPYLLDQLTGQISASHLAASLSSRIDLIDGSELLAGSVNARLASAVTTLEAADETLSQQMLTLSAGIGEQFDGVKVWYFNTTVEDWGGNGAPTASGGWLSPADHATDAYVTSPIGLAVDGDAYSQVKLRIRKVGSPTWEGYLWWAAPSGTWGAGSRETFSEPTFDANGIAVVTVTAPWSGTIDAIRLDLSTASSGSDKYEIDWVAIGRPSPGASVAALQQEITARASADSALSSTISTMAARLNTGGDTYTAIVQAQTTASAKNANFAQGTAPTATKVGDTWLNTSEGNKLYRWTGTSWVPADDQRIGASASSIATLQSTYTTLNSDVGTLQTNVASLQTSASTQASQITGLSAQFTVKTDLNGYVSGFGLASEAPVNGSPSSEFAVIADRFSIAPVATNPAADDGAPFFHLTVPTTINGVTVPAGTYMKSAFIHNAAIVGAQIQNAAIDDAKIANLSVAKLIGGSLSVGQYIQSSNFISGSAGFRINANGTAEFSGVVVRGTVYASAGLIGGTAIGANYLQSAGYVAGSSGYRLNQDGSAAFYNLTARGDIQAQTLAAGASIQSPAIFGGSYTAAYAWPASGGGFHLSSGGLLLGNGNTGSYFQVTAAGNVYAPGFSIVGGAMTVSALNVIGTGQVVNEAITVPRSLKQTVTFSYPATSSVNVDNALVDRPIHLMASLDPGGLQSGSVSIAVEVYYAGAWRSTGISGYGAAIPAIPVDGGGSGYPTATPAVAIGSWTPGNYGLGSGTYAFRVVAYGVSTGGAVATLICMQGKR